MPDKATAMRPRVTSFAPQFLVADLERSIGYYEKLGLTFGKPWEGFYAIGHLDGLELHLKEAPKNEDERRFRRDNEHLDAAAGVDGPRQASKAIDPTGVTFSSARNNSLKSTRFAGGSIQALAR
jgi:catechol 2,3-dioxygenase-like lactoylglutathione lyase family enzyme